MLEFSHKYITSPSQVTYNQFFHNTLLTNQFLRVSWRKKKIFIKYKYITDQRCQMEKSTVGAIKDVSFTYVYTMYSAESYMMLIDLDFNKSKQSNKRGHMDFYF